MALVLSDWNLTVAIAVAVVLATAFYRWRLWKLSFLKRMGIPGPEPHLISGNFDQLWTSDTVKVMDEWSKKYGDIYGIYNGDAPFLMVKDLELIRRVFITDFAVFTNRGEVWSTMNGNQYMRHSMSFAVGDRWRFARRSVSAAFTGSKMRLMMDAMNKAVDRFLDLLEARCLKASDGEANIYPLIGSLAFDVVAETACGLYLDVQHKPNDQYFDSARSYMLNIVESAYQRIGQFFSEVKSILALTCMLELQFGCEPLTALSRKSEPIVALREKDQSLARPDVIQSLLDAKVPQELLRWREFRERTDDKGNFLMPLQAVATNAATVLTAGDLQLLVDSNLVSFLMHKVRDCFQPADPPAPSVSPSTLRCRKRVRQEVNAVYEKYGGFTYDAIKDLTYTRQTVDESLRLYPPVVAFASRKASCDYLYKDMVLPKGLSIMACTEQIHKDPPILGSAGRV
ncbi:hypothetical protein MTO96_034346 [Rhipicephalus appendiculatus]